MPKMKSHSGAKKRFKRTATGKLKRERQNAAHILTKKDNNRKLRLRKQTTVQSTKQERAIKHLIQKGK